MKAKPKTRTTAPDPTVIAVVERLYPLIDAHLNRENVASHLRAQIAARELELRDKELELRFKEHELRAAEAAQDHAERRQRLLERMAKDTQEVAS